MVWPQGELAGRRVDPILIVRLWGFLKSKDAILVTYFHCRDTITDKVNKELRVFFWFMVLWKGIEEVGTEVNGHIVSVVRKQRLRWCSAHCLRHPIPPFSLRPSPWRWDHLYSG